MSMPWCSDARFMADGIYLITLEMTDTFYHYELWGLRNGEEMVLKVLYCLTLLQKIIYKSSYNMAVEYYNLGGALSQEHGKACLVSQCPVGSLWCWPLKMRRWIKAVRFKWSKSFWVLRSRQAFLCKNQSFLNCQPTELVDLLGPESWILFHQTHCWGKS